MSSQALNRRLDAIKSRIPVYVESEQEKALQYILGNLDTLAHKKQTGDPTVQVEIEEISAFKKSNCTI